MTNDNQTKITEKTITITTVENGYILQVDDKKYVYTKRRQLSLALGALLGDQKEE